MKLVSVQQMIALEKEADRSGLTYQMMMANAGLALAQVIHRRYFKRPQASVLGLVGSGNNGGDTLVALNHLADWGWQTQAYLVKDRKEDDELLMAYRQAGGEVYTAVEDETLGKLIKLVYQTDLILDGVLGTGIKLPLRGDAKKVLDMLKEMPDLPPIVAVDCPSGVDCDSGKAAKQCLAANLTVCMAAVKQGLLKQPAIGLTGEICTVDIGLGDNLRAWKGVDTEVVDAPMVASMLPERPGDGHKGTFGTAMLAAGSINYCGAVVLASKAAYRVGAGLVRAAVPGAIYDTLAGQSVEATWLILPHSLGAINEEGARIVLENLENVDVLLLGPGWGQARETLNFLEKMITPRSVISKKHLMGFESGLEEDTKQDFVELPNLVIDADALKLLSKIEGWHELLNKQAVLTPHPGEMAVLTGLSTKEIQAQREDIARKYAKEWGHVVVLKGAVTVVADPQGELALIPFASSALATAGTGDVLAGMISGLIAQGMNAFEAAKAGAWLHAKAGVLAAEHLGSEAAVVAGDVLAAIPDAINAVMKYTE